ncbi:hypothetical protein [Endozoicomonas elysicola]|uniref:C2H2-type domain-containing protein n=1 Tax=Endozoicomonas elysicola TaxID=305900 RepID=A0A081KAD4_9GAMM|nr:hypothetical protein [Endozoicomonas elysicola]KEI71110.1 hypothetical protein GV64_10450 [Endozoicomonas elysicola]
MDSSLPLIAAPQLYPDIQMFELCSITPYGPVNSIVFGCKRCYLTFPDFNACNNHISRTRKEKNQYVCVFDRCVERFASRTNLGFHYQRTKHDQMAQHSFDDDGAMDLSVRNQRECDDKHELDVNPGSHDSGFPSSLPSLCSEIKSEPASPGAYGESGYENQNEPTFCQNQPQPSSSSKLCLLPGTSPIVPESNCFRATATQHQQAFSSDVSERVVDSGQNGSRVESSLLAHPVSVQSFEHEALIEREVKHTEELSISTVKESALEFSATANGDWEQVEAKQHSDVCHQVGKSEVVQSGVDGSRSLRGSGTETGSHSSVESSPDRTANQCMVTSLLSTLKKASEKLVSSETYKSDRARLLESRLRLEVANAEWEPIKNPVDNGVMRPNTSVGNTGFVVSDNKNKSSSKRSHNQVDTNNELASHKVPKVVLTRLSKDEIAKYTAPDVKTEVSYPGLTDGEVSYCLSAHVELEKLPSWQVTRKMRGED